MVEQANKKTQYLSFSHYCIVLCRKHFTIIFLVLYVWIDCTVYWKDSVCVVFHSKGRLFLILPSMLVFSFCTWYCHPSIFGCLDNTEDFWIVVWKEFHSPVSVDYHGTTKNSLHVIITLRPKYKRNVNHSLLNQKRYGSMNVEMMLLLQRRWCSKPHVIRAIC